MTERRVPYHINGVEVEAYDVPIVAGHEGANELILEDGAVVRIKTVTLSIIRIVGQKDGAGNQAYMVNSTTISSVVKNPKERSKLAVVPTPAKED